MTCLNICLFECPNGEDVERYGTARPVFKGFFLDKGCCYKTSSSYIYDCRCQAKLAFKEAPSSFQDHHHDLSTMTQPLSEDDIYRTSTQYRLWSFSPETLAALRKKTHELAIERARRYSGQRLVGNVIESVTNGDGSAQQYGEVNGGHIEYLTEEEELRLVQRYCDQIRTTSDHFKWPVNVKVQRLGDAWVGDDCANRDAIGHGSAIPETLLPFELMHDIPTKRDLQDHPLSSMQD